MTKQDGSLSAHEQRLYALAQKRRALDTMTEEKALAFLLSDREALPLIHSCPDEDLFFLMHRIGAEDFTPVLSMAKPRQWQYILDQETWQDDRPDTWAMSRWFSRLFSADPKRFVQWMLDEQTELLEYYLFWNIEVRAREHDEDPSDFPEGFETVDDVIYYRLRDMPDADTVDRETRDQREHLLRGFLRQLSHQSHDLYLGLLQELQGVIPAETEEAELRWRNIRLAEKGFQPWETAGRLFQPLQEGELAARGRKTLRGEMDAAERFGVPGYADGLWEREGRFSDAVALYDAQGIQAELSLELATLCNQLISARREVIRSREELDGVVDMVFGYLTIGVARISGKETPDAVTIAGILRSYRLEYVFRAGYGPLLRLKWRADNWRRSAWFIGSGLPLSFWDEEWMGTLGGLFLPLPKRFDATASGGQYYREFSSGAELQAAESALEAVMGVDDLLALFGVSEVDPHGRLLTWKNLLLTLWARSCLDGVSVQTPLIPLHVERFRVFYAGLWEEKDGVRKIPTEKKDAFLHWIAQASALPADQVADRLGGVLEILFAEVESEMAGVSPEDIDDRFQHLFLVRPV